MDNIETLQKHIDDLQFKVTILTDQLLQEYAENHEDKTRHTLIKVLGEREFYARFATCCDFVYDEDREAMARLIRG